MNVSLDVADRLFGAIERGEYADRRGHVGR